MSEDQESVGSSGSGFSPWVMGLGVMVFLGAGFLFGKDLLGDAESDQGGSPSTVSAPPSSSQDGFETTPSPGSSVPSDGTNETEFPSEVVVDPLGMLFSGVNAEVGIGSGASLRGATSVSSSCGWLKGFVLVLNPDGSGIGFDPEGFNASIVGENSYVSIGSYGDVITGGYSVGDTEYVIFDGTLDVRVTDTQFFEAGEYPRPYVTLEVTAEWEGTVSENASGDESFGTLTFTCYHIVFYNQPGS